MKKGMSITLFSVLFLMFGVAACNEDENSTACNIPESINKKAEAAYTITHDDVDARMNKLFDKYYLNRKYYVNREVSIDFFDEDFFLIYENWLRKSAGLEPLEKSSTSFHNQ